MYRNLLLQKLEQYLCYQRNKRGGYKLGHKIALISPAGGGKDFIAEHLGIKFGLTRYAFADEVKAVAKMLFPEIYGDGSKKSRELLQQIGTMFREIDPDVWVKALFKNIDEEANERKRLHYATEHIVVTDCRMPNEYIALKNRGFTFIKIEVDSEERMKRLIERGDVFSEDNLKHQTESHYDEFICDYFMHNQGSKEDAYYSVDEIVEAMIKGVEPNVN